MIQAEKSPSLLTLGRRLTGRLNVLRQSACQACRYHFQAGHARSKCSILVSRMRGCAYG